MLALLESIENSVMSKNKGVVGYSKPNGPRFDSGDLLVHRFLDWGIQ